MSKMLRSALCLVLCGLMVLAGVACNSAPDVLGVTVDPNTPYGKYSQEIKFTTVGATEIAANFPEGMSYANNPYWDFVKSEINAVPKILWESTDYNQKLLLDISAGQVPDIFVVKDYATYQQLYLSDLLEDMTDVYETYASDKTKEIFETYNQDYIFGPVTEGGRIMAIPCPNSVYDTQFMWIRKDWLDILGLEVPHTLEEIEAVARAFVEQDPGGNGPGNTVGIVFNREAAFTSEILGLQPVANAFGAYPGKWMADDSGKVYYGSTTPEFKQSLSLIRNWISSGLVRKDLFDTNWETLWSDVVKGNAGIWFYGWGFPLGGELKKNNPRAEVVCVNAPLNSEGKFSYAARAPFNSVLCVRKGFEYPELVFKIIDLATDMQNGDHEAGYEALQPLFDANTLWYAAFPFNGFKFTFNDDMSRGVEKLDNFLKTGEIPEKTSPATLKDWNQIKAWATGASTDPLDWGLYTACYLSISMGSTEVCEQLYPCYSFQTQSMVDNWSTLQQLEQLMVRKIMIGEESIDYFDTYVADWKEMGGDDIVAEIQSIIDKK